jgi:hypothetical protein
VFTSTLPELMIVQSRISPESWADRISKARSGAKVLRAIARRVDAGEPLDRAIRVLVPAKRRSWVIHHWPSFRKNGWEGLIDLRVPREPKLAKDCGPLIEAARAANRKLTPEGALQVLRDQHVRVLPSVSTIKVHFRRSDERARYRQKKEEASLEVVELPLAGAELLAAAEVETGGMAALTDEVQVLQQKAQAASKGREPVPDRGRRDEQGHFTAGYNRARRRKRGEAIAAYLRSAKAKAEGKVPSWPRFVDEGRETLEGKVRMLTCSWMVSDTAGWNALRAPRVAGLASVCGFAYLPSTLSKFTSALAQSDAGPALLQTVGVHWHPIAQARWGERGAMAALYFDNHVKEVWTSLFTQSGKVSHLNRVMPCITNTFVHTGAGTPLVVSVQSGTAPLAPRLGELVQQANELLGSEVKRAVVIDAEGSTFDILESFTRAKQIIVTPLKPSRVSDLAFTYGRGSYYRPYREHDQLRVGQVTLTQKSSGRSQVVSALRVKREHRASDTVLLTNGVELGMEGPDLADLYYERWPLQENAFKEGAAVHLVEHRGNCAEMVANVAVVTEMEQLEKRIRHDQQRLRELSGEREKLAADANEAQHNLVRAQAKLAVRRRREALIAAGRVQGKQLGGAAIEQQTALRQAEAATRAQKRAAKAQEHQAVQRTRLEARIKEAHHRCQHLQPQRQIRQVDVALDSVLTAFKLTAAMLISFVLREYFASRPMSPETFVARVMTVSGRKELRPGEEQVVFYENPRDPEINIAMAAACDELNRRKLKRTGRRLRFRVDMAQIPTSIPVG